jgi:hypothetical protein
LHTADPLFPELRSFELGIRTENLEMFISSGIYQIPTELFGVGSSKYGVRFVNFLFKFRTATQLTEFNIVPIFTKGAMKLAALLYPNIFLCSLFSYADEMNLHNQCSHWIEDAHEIM